MGGAAIVVEVRMEEVEERELTTTPWRGCRGGARGWWGCSSSHGRAVEEGGVSPESRLVGSSRAGCRHDQEKPVRADGSGTRRKGGWSQLELMKREQEGDEQKLGLGFGRAQ